MPIVMDDATVSEDLWYCLRAVWLAIENCPSDAVSVTRPEGEAFELYDWTTEAEGLLMSCVKQFHNDMVSEA